MTFVLKRLTLLPIVTVGILIGLAGCSNTEPQGFMPGDKEGLGHGIPAPEPTKEAAPAPAPGGSPAAGDPAKKPGSSGGEPLPEQAAPTQGEAKNTLGYTPDAEGAQSGKPTTP